MYANYLAHYGVLGMKWGVRRYQPYSVRGRVSGKGGKEIGEARKASGPSHDDLVKSTNAKEVYANRSKLNDRELRERVNRIQTEQQLKQIVDASEKKGKSVTTKLLRAVEAAAITAVSNWVVRYAEKEIIPSLIKNVSSIDTVAEALEVVEWMKTPMSALNVWPT